MDDKNVDIGDVDMDRKDIDMSISKNVCTKCVFAAKFMWMNMFVRRLSMNE